MLPWPFAQNKVKLKSLIFIKIQLVIVSFFTLFVNDEALIFDCEGFK